MFFSHLQRKRLSIPGAEETVVCSDTHSIHHTSLSLPLSGQLGIGSSDNHCSPQPVSLPNGVLPKHVFCGSDCSMVITTRGAVLATGCNRSVKLRLYEIFCLDLVL